MSRLALYLLGPPRAELDSKPDCCLLTPIGARGIGKTRLTLEATAAQERGQARDLDATVAELLIELGQ